MNPKIKLALVIMIPLVGISLWVFSLFSLLTPADIAPTDQKDTSDSWTTIIPSQSIHSGSSPTIKPLTGTQSINTWSQNTNTISTPSSLTIAMPIWMVNEAWRRPIINKLRQQSITIRIITNTRDQSYKTFVNTLLSGWNTWADIILVDQDQLEEHSRSIGSFGFSQDLSPLFSYIFFEYFKRTDVTFIPFGVDPMVTFMKKPLENTTTQSIDRDDIVNSIATQEQDDPRKLAVQIPILFGIDSLDIQLIKNHKEAYDGYMDTLKNILFQSSNRSELVEKIRQFSDPRLEDYKLWDYAKYKRVSKTLIERNPKCQLYPKLCFMYYKLTSVSFGYLSEMDIINKYFQQSSYTIYNFPNSSNVYPVKLRWWVVNKSRYNEVIKGGANGVSLAWTFFQEYVNQATNGNHYLWPTLFSAFNSVLDSQESDLQWRYISQFKSKRQVNPITINTKDSFDQLVALLKGEYDLQVFLAGIIR